MPAPDRVDLDVFLAEWAHALMVGLRLLRLWLAVWHRAVPLSLDQSALGRLYADETATVTNWSGLRYG
jgi:hypothetical protein